MTEIIKVKYFNVYDRREMETFYEQHQDWSFVSKEWLKLPNNDNCFRITLTKTVDNQATEKLKSNKINFVSKRKKHL